MNEKRGKREREGEREPPHARQGCSIVGGGEVDSHEMEIRVRACITDGSSRLRARARDDAGT